jgi:hypothetical protein
MIAQLKASVQSLQEATDVLTELSKRETISDEVRELSIAINSVVKAHLYALSAISEVSK